MPKFGQNRVFGAKFSLAPPLAAHRAKLKFPTRKIWLIYENAISVSVNSGSRFHAIFPGQNRQIRVIWGLRPAEQALLFNQNPNVSPLLFTDLIVVLLLLLTIRTVFSS